MDSVDRIVPIVQIGVGPQLKVAESNKDSNKRNSPDEQPHEAPHDVLELHDEEVILDDAVDEESEDPPEFGLDLAV